MRYLILVLVLFFVVGCGAMRKGLIELSKQDVKNAEAVREAATNFLSTWLINSGFIRGALGERIEEFPAQFITAMNRLDTIAVGAPPTDYILGYSLGLRVRTLETLVQEALKAYAPDIFRLIPFPLKF